jgi:hypothetical protein
MEGLVGVRNWDFEVREGSTNLYRIRQMQLVCECPCTRESGLFTAEINHSKFHPVTYREGPEGE